MAIDYRTDYRGPGLTDNSLHADPVEQFEEWFRAAQQAGIPEPNAMTLATASAQGEPAARMLLLKQADARGFTFFTNYGSAKAADLGFESAGVSGVLLAGAAPPGEGYRIRVAGAVGGVGGVLRVAAARGAGWGVGVPAECGVAVTERVGGRGEAGGDEV